ncbi:hypothetical protein EDC94DRAFT_155740 [Helicostylum pulchrum]|nr:hypothetical protein EDC94DRAFT_155740 [Helicostylum pulchrum]
MDSIDDSIWADFDTDLLSLIDVESKKSNDPILPNEKKNTTSIPSKNVTPVNEKTSIDDKFLLKQQNDKALCHGFTTARGTALPPPSKEAKLKATRLLQTVGKGDNIELSLSVDENLFLPLNEPKEDVSPIDKERDQSDSSLFENNDLSPTSIYTPVYKLEPIIKDDDDDCASISSYEDVFLPLSFKYKPLPPPGASQPKPSTSGIKLPLSPPIVQNELSPVSEPSIEQIIPGSTDDLGLPPISVDESLFLPQVTEDGHVIKELPTPTGPAAGFQSAKLIKSVHTPKENHNYSHSHINNTNIPETPKPIITPVESSSTNIPKEPCTSSFTTAAGKKLEEPSLEGVQRATALFDSSKKPNKHDAVINEYGGFKSGYSNKSFDISPQAKRKAILVLDEIDEEVKRKKVRVATDKSQKDFGSFVSSELQLQGTFKGLPKASFTTASGKELGEPCLEDIQRATALFDSSKKPNKHDAVINEYGGFKTGNSNKSFDISSQAKRKAISVLDEIDEEVKCKKIRVAANKSQKDLEPFQMENTSIASPELQLQGTSKGPPKASFATASGKKLGEPSLEGIQRATALFDSSKKPNKHDAVINEYGGFKTGNSNKSFDISSQAKRKAISVLNEVNKEVESKDIRLTPPLDIINTPNGIGKRVSASKYIPKSFDNDTSKLQQVQMKDSTKNELSSDSITSRKDSAESHNATATDLKSPTINAVVPNKPSTSIFPKRNINRAASIQTKNKPFKSPIIKSNIELTKAAVNNRSSLKAKLTPVFNLEVPDFRFKLYTLGAPGTFTKSQLIADNIPISVINMTISTAKRYVFDGNWGPKEALRDMIEAGALPRRVTIEWVENHYVLILWKIACLIRSYNAFMDRWKPQAILEQLLYRYEREINMGHRPVLRRILEKDDLPVKHMILMITDIVEIRSSIQYNTCKPYLI